MSLSTLLEAAKYLDYLDSSNQQHQQQQGHSQFGQQTQQTSHQASSLSSSTKQKSSRRRMSKKNAANMMLAMSLPTQGHSQMQQGVPIPVVGSAGSDNHSHHQAASLSSSFTTGSPLSSFASTALFCSKASGVTSASSSAASSLSSSDSSSSCGEILMGDNDFNQSLVASNNNTSKNINNNNQLHIDNSNATNHHNYHITHLQQQQQSFDNQKQFGSNNINIGANKHQSIARYIAATSNGPQLVTMTTNSAMASASAPIDGNMRAGHVIHAANGAILNAANAATGTSFDSCHHISLTSGNASGGRGFSGHEGPTFNVAAGSYGSDTHLSGSPGSSCAPMIMARVQPMILNSLSPSAQSIMAFQPTIASSPTSSSSSYLRHRELHKTLEKNRRAHLRHCFELLKAELPASECVDKKTSHINIIKSAIRYVLALRQQECEIDSELQRLTKMKVELTENLSKLRIGDALSSPTATATTSQTSIEEMHDIKQEHPQQKHQQSEQQQPPVAEQQLSFLLSQSKIDN